MFSLAVVKGAGKGHVLRTDRKRISVGAARDNDLVLTDPEIAARHFMVLIDQGRWRIHTFSADSSITVDRRWSHPSSGNRGALIHAAGIEILLYPGNLEDRVVEREINQRASAAKPVSHEVSDEEADLVTRIAMSPVEFWNSKEDEAKERTVTAKPPKKREPQPRPPSDARWEEETVGVEWDDGKPKPKTFGAKEPAKGNAWDRASGENPRTRSDRPKVGDIPEVLAEPESQMLVSPVQKSVMAPLPDLDKPPKAPTSGRNAWGDAVGGTSRPQPKSNAWGDSPDRVASTVSSSAGAQSPLGGGGARNAWGDPAERQARGNDRNDRNDRNGRSEPERGLDRARARGFEITIEDLAVRTDPALAIVREPDGTFATSIRLLGARIEDMVRTLGYRAYMMTSPEPLTGKTTSACNLAFALAEDTHRRVALVEANFRYPRIAEIVGAPDDLGLIALLEGRAQLPEISVKVSDRNLVILPAGGRRANPAELLSSSRFKTLIAELANTVDIAIIDAPAVTPAADVNLLIPLLDAALLVVVEGRTHATWVSRAATQIGLPRVVGSLYNKLPRATMKRLKRDLKERMR